MTHSRPHPIDEPRTPSAIVAEGGNVLRLVGVGSAFAGGRRGIITGFSPAARRRMIRDVQEIDRSQAAEHRYFVTLTYPGAFSKCSERWKRDLAAFRKRLWRAFRIQFAYVKLEPQRRLAPHFHILVFSHDPIPKEWVSTHWWQCVGSGRLDHLAAGTRVDRLTDWEGVGRYVSKYVAKVVDGRRLPDWWQGIKWWNRWGDPPKRLRTEELGYGAFVWTRRLMARMARSRGCRLRRRRMHGLTVFMGSPTAARILGVAKDLAPQVAEPPSEFLTGGRYRGIPSGYGKERSDGEGGPAPDRPGRRTGGEDRGEPVPGGRACAGVGPR